MRHKMTSDGAIPFTPEEEAQADLDEAKAALPRVPLTIEMRQCRLALLSAGMLDQAKATLAAMTGPEGEAARINWEFSTSVRRDSALVSATAKALGLTSGQLDQLFIGASQL
jgi:hypothetical protein